MTLHSELDINKIYNILALEGKPKAHSKWLVLPYFLLYR